MSDDQVQALTERVMRIEARIETMPTAADFARIEARLGTLAARADLERIEPRLDTKPFKAFAWQGSVGTIAALTVAVLDASIGVVALT